MSAQKINSKQTLKFLFISAFKCNITYVRKPLQQYWGRWYLMGLTKGHVSVFQVLFESPSSHLMFIEILGKEKSGNPLD